ncbi:MAG: hypothetical protein RLZZ206_3020 [Cyanobacteriota bacterium]|jgi:hypothetical protein
MSIAALSHIASLLLSPYVREPLVLLDFLWGMEGTLSNMLGHD